MSTPQSKPTTLYRFFDAEGVLLYVGISSIGAMRWVGHQSREWWIDVATVTTEHFPDRDLAAEAEIVAIRTEKPRHNVIYVDPPRTRGPQVFRRHGMGSITYRKSDGRWAVAFMEDDKRRFHYTRTREDAELILAAYVGRNANPLARAKAIELLGGPDVKRAAKEGAA